MIANAPVIRPVPGNSDIVPQVCSPWDDTTFLDVQSRAEEIVYSKLDDQELPAIVSIVRDSSVPIGERIGYPAYTPLNFYDNLADETNPDSFLDGLDLAGIRGELPEGPEGPGWTMWMLPGHGSERTRYQCGKFLTSKTYGCPEGHELHAVRCGCNRLGCPVCWTDKVRRNANHIHRRLKIVDQLYNGPKWYHVIVSPPQDRAKEQWSTRDGYKRSKAEALAVLKKAGAFGGVMVCHPYRQNNGSMEWRAGPHFHALVNGRINWAKVPAGWVVSNKGERPIDAMFSVAYYLCSHAGVGLGGVNKNGQQMSINSVSYFGNCGTNNGNAPGILREDVANSTMECKTCSMGLYRVREYYQMLFGRLDFVSPVPVKYTVRAWCIRSDIDELRIEANGLDMWELSGALGPRVFIEDPDSDKELTSSDVADIDAEFSIEANRRPSVGRPSHVPRSDLEAVGVSVGSESANVPSSPGPGGGGKRGFPGVAGHV